MRSAFGPQLLGITVVVSTALVMAGSVLPRAGVLGMALALSLLLIPNYLHWGVSQICGCSLWAGHADRGRVPCRARRCRPLRRAGLAVGFVVWTKAECMASLSPSWSRLSACDGRVATPLLGWLAARFAVGGLALLLFKLTLIPPPGDLLEQIANQRPLEKLADAGRHGVVAWSMDANCP